MKFGRPHHLLLSIGSISGALLSFGYYLEFAEGLSPCLLCIMQRYCYFFLIFFAAAGLVLIKSRASQLVISLVLTLFSSLGIVLASRQIWLQRFSTQESLECIPSLNFLIETLPWDQIFYKIYLGGTDCAKVDWVFLGGSIADWSAAWFALLLLASVTLSLRREDF